MNQELDDILEELKKNPIFKMSLGSKELFHSNFLEYLWDIDDKKKNRFSNVIAMLLKGRILDFKPGSVFDREKENFDVCIHHCENKNKKNGEQGQKTKDVYDLIIENKVKSIPRKDQLEEYEEKAKGKGNPVFLLLSLVRDFPCRNELIDDKSPWIVAHYDQLKEAIENHYKDVGERNLKYITDYCQFIGQMHKLQEHMIQDIDKQVYYDEEELNEYKKLRIHDLYIKLRGSMFITRLKEKLKEQPIGATIHILPFNITDNKKKTRSFKYEDIRPFCKEKGGVHVFLDCTIQRGSGMIAAYIYKHRTNCDYIYEVVIQGDEYRHGINSSNESDFKLLPSNYSDKDKEEANKLLKLWTAVNNENAGFFQEIHNSTQTCPEHFRKYAPYCVYKYVKLKKKETVSELIVAFAKDIINIIPKLN